MLALLLGSPSRRSRWPLIGLTFFHPDPCPSAVLAEGSRALREMRFKPFHMCLTLARVTPGSVTVCSAAMPPVLIHRAASGEIEEPAGGRHHLRRGSEPARVLRRTMRSGRAGRLQEDDAMDDPTILAMVLVFSIPILGILSGFAKEWLKLRTQQRASNRKLERKVERLEKVNADYSQRLENLEAVVASKTWDVLQEPGLSETDRQRRLAAAGRHEVHAPAAEEMNPQRVAHLARRLGG